MDDTWRERLERSILDRGKTLNAVSVEAGFAPNYVHGVLRLGKEPTVGRLLTLCSVIPVSPIYILLGVDASPGDEEILRLLRDNPRAREGILAILAPDASA